MKGGNRYGAGRPATKQQTGRVAQLDVRRLARERLLAAGTSTTWKWSNGLVAAVTVHSHDLALSYRYSFSDGDRNIEVRIELETTPCGFGGSRTWFACPRCHKRVAILYLWGWPRCRVCARMAYPSQSEDAIARSWRRTRKLEKKLAPDGGEWSYQRPTGMRLATFERLTGAYWKEEDLRDMALADFVARMGHFLN